MATADSVRIINTAISRQNGNTITSTNDGSKEATLFDLNYEQIVTDALIGPAWRFARKTVLLTDEAETPADTDWAYTLALPSDLLMLRAVIVNGQPIDYELAAAGTILANENDNVYAIYTYRVDESDWPADFTEGIVRRLEAVLLRSDEKQSDADDRDAAADKKFAEARRAHAMEEAAKDPFSYPLLAARRIGNAPSRL